MLLPTKDSRLPLKSTTLPTPKHMTTLKYSCQEDPSVLKYESINLIPNKNENQEFINANDSINCIN
ncbi:hypothetical protein LVDJXP189_860004 [Flavobacterium psychrophilum]|nr:hypothetical protein LVDJXP189_860004 [Flavobacterium psychrophilum]